MSDHAHEWIWWQRDERHAGIIFRCDSCDEILEWGEILRRLNATERLSAEDANFAAVGVGHYRRVSDALLAYAAALEGE